MRWRFETAEQLAQSGRRRETIMRNARNVAFSFITGLSCLAGQVNDPTASIREVLDRQFPTELLRDQPALAVGYFLVATASELNKNLSEVKVDRAGNAIF